MNNIIGYFLLGATMTAPQYLQEDSQSQFKDNISYSKENAHKYAQFGIEGTSWLAFRDTPEFIKKYVKGKKTLDLGCGAGRSTRFLQSLGLDVIGTDISSEYLDQANSLDCNSHYVLMKKGMIPCVDNTYDFVFSSFVLLMEPSKKDLTNTLKEVNRVLKQDGIFIAVTGSEEMHSVDKHWISYETDFSENKNPKSGDRLRLFIKGAEASFMTIIGLMKIIYKFSRKADLQC